MHNEQRARYRRILRFAALWLSQTWWYERALPTLGMRRITERTRTARAQRIARRFHALAVELGGLMIKVGQYMSSRLDVLPPEVTRELEGLQDEVPAVPFERLRPFAERELGGALPDLFASFDRAPIAAASLGQAHRARLQPAMADAVGFADVVVKVQRPGIDEIVAVDLDALRRIARWLSRVRAVARRADMPALIEEFAATSLREIDYLAEAAHAEEFAEMFAGDPRVSAPETVWDRTTRRVLTLSDVTAIKIADVDALRAAGIDPSEVAHEFARVMFDQVFTFGTFHADPHPGNIFVTPHSDGSWQLTFIDFGMMGNVSDRLRAGLRRVMIAAAARDGRGLVAAMSDVGVLLPSADTRELERALTALFARFGGMGFAQLRGVDEREFRDFAREFRDVVRELPFQLPDNFLLVVRAMSLTSGVASTLDRDFNLWDAVEPYAAGIVRDEAGSTVRDLARNAVDTAATIWRLPARIEGVIDRLEEGSISVDLAQLDRRVARVEGLARRMVSAILFGVLLVAGILLLPAVTPLGVVMMCASVIPLLHAVFSRTGAPR